MSGDVEGGQPRCTHCGAPLGGGWCARCGQPVRRGRLEVPALLRRGVAEFFDLEAGLLRTLRDLVIDPGAPIRGWWAGHTRPWVHPVRFFLLAFAFAQLVAWRVGALDEIAAGFTSASEGIGTSTVVAFLADYFVLLIAGGLLFPILLVRLATRRTVAEITVLAFYTSSALATTTAVLLLVRALVPGFPGDFLAAGITPVYTGWVVARVFETGPVRSVLAGLVLTAATYVGAAFLGGMVSGFAG